MKLYYSPGACSLSPHIALREAGLVPELVRVDLRSKRTEAGDDYLAVNPNGYVPALAVDEGILTEGPAIVQYIADRMPERKLAPANGSFERYLLQSRLNFISTELHKSFGAFFNPAATDDWKRTVRGLLERRLNYVDGELLTRGPYVMGERFTVADGYLFTVLSWTKPLQIDISPWPRIAEYLDRIVARPAVQEALRAEGLL